MSEQQSKAHGTEGEPMDHEYDGIKEYDNPLPRWWVWIFWATFLFAIGYGFHYHWSGHGQGRLAVLEEETRIAGEIAMKLAAKEKVTEESLAKLSHNSASVSAGAALYAARCQSCHAEKGKGLIGPNLTDGYWLHGKGQLMDIYSTVSEGVLAKGMPAWNKQLSPIELRSVVAFVATLRGLNLPGKAPQGEPVSNGKGATAESNPVPAGSNPVDAAASAAPLASASPSGSVAAPEPAAASSSASESKPDAEKAEGDKVPSSTSSAGGAKAPGATSAGAASAPAASAVGAH